MKRSSRLFPLLLLLVSFPSRATQHVWTGALSSSWSDPGNWTGGSPAGDPASALVFGGAGTNLVSTDDIPGVLQVASISFQGGAYVVGAAPGSSIALAGGIDSSATFDPITFGIPVLLSGGVLHEFMGRLAVTGVLSGSSTNDTVRVSNGAVVFSADNLYTGDTFAGNFIGGDLTVDGAQPSSAVTVAGDSSVLRGRGTVGSIAAAASGTVAPGTAAQTGTLTAAGNVFFGSGLSDNQGRYAVRLDGPTPGSEFDQLVVQGNVTMGDVGVLPRLFVTLGYDIPIGDSFTVISSTGVVSGQFLVTTSGVNAGCQAFDASYLSHAVVLTRIAGSAPVPGVSISLSGPATLCSNGTGGTATLSESGGCENTHQWGYRTTSGGAVTDIPGATAASYLLKGADFPGAGTYQLVESTTPTGGVAAISNEIAVTIVTAPLAIASGSATICPGGSAHLTGSGGSACSWSPVAGLSDPSSCNPSAHPSTTTTYHLTVTGNGCPSTNSPAVTVTVNPGCATSFYTLAPCRIVDTRGSTGPAGGPALAPLATRTFPLTGACGVPLDAVSLSANLTVVSPTEPGFVNAYAFGLAAPNTSIVSFRAGVTRANHVNLQLATDGTGRVAVANGSSGSLDIVLDVTGFYR